ncbi:FRG domain-containing protein, partial [Salinivibrio sp. VYel6]|uniref:FRG domain-containing protein n=1 Tax=Salinivibrio sp. VYel6 TaxID=2490493 RepID=UPI00128DA67D
MNTVHVENWSKLRDYFSKNYLDSYSHLFRGHADASWLLESTLTRLSKSVGSSFSAEVLEGKQLENFRLRIRGLRGDNPPELKNTELWSLGQHYGLATPLLDWTDSPYIAAYFAFESVQSCSSGSRAIFVLNRSILQDELKNTGNFDLEFIQPIKDENPRLIAQSGSFTKIPTSLSLEDWLQKNQLSQHLTKIIIPNESRLDALNELKLMNILGTSIYPDLTGAAVACNMW